MTHALNARPGRTRPSSEELLIDAEVDDEPVPPAPPLRPWLLLLGLVLVALNLRPALSSLAPCSTRCATIPASRPLPPAC